MPLYEYQTLNPQEACPHCRDPFKVLQGLHDRPLEVCPDCSRPVRKIVSWCRAAIMEISPEGATVEKTITDHEKSGQWSHAAELADKHAEKTKDDSLKTRALENYKKAGYDV